MMVVHLRKIRVRMVSVIAVGAVVAGLTLEISQAYSQEPESRPLPSPPPRTSSDITEILDREQPDLERIRKNREKADAVVGGSMSNQERVDFFHKRGVAAGVLGRIEQAQQDLRRALDLSKQHGGRTGNIALSLYSVEMTVGNLRTGLEVARERMEAEKGARAGTKISAMSMLTRALIVNGRIKGAEEKLEVLHRLIRRLPEGMPEPYRRFLAGQVMDAEAQFLMKTGKTREAAELFAQSVVSVQDFVEVRGGYERVPEGLMARLSAVQTYRAIALLRIGRQVESEVVARDLLLLNLRRNGKYAPRTARAITLLAGSVFSQGRFAEAEALGHAADDILATIGAPLRSTSVLLVRMRIARALSGQGKWAEAAEIVRDIENLVSADPLLFERVVSVTVDPVMIYYRVGEIDAGLALIQKVLGARMARFGEKHYLTAEARGFLALGKFLNGEQAAALDDFRASIPLLLSRSRQVDQEGALVTAPELRRREVIDGYIAILAQVYQNAALSVPGFDPAAEAFRISDAGRGSTVQRAVAQSSARAAARDPKLAELVRKEQDLLRETRALFGLLTSLLSAPEDQRDNDVAQDLRDEIDDLRGERAEIREKLEEKFPDYVRLIDPRPATLEDVRAALADDEAAFVSYVTADKTYVWSFGKSGPVGFATAPLGKARLSAAATQLRRAVDPDAVTLADIPDFNIALAHRLYAALLQPVAESWKDASHLVVVADGPLGQIPFSLLPTGNVELGADKEIIFDRYRDVPWLTRTHSVTVMPSVASLIALRALADTPGAAQAFVGFGDPVFSNTQLASVAGTEGDAFVSRGGLRMRNVPVRLRSLPKMRDIDSAEFGMLPRLPDTADEIRAMAAAMHADPARDVFLGKAANETAVRQTSLKDYRVVAFATHGLVPGDINGLLEPALAMTAPHIAGDPNGDGLLTMGEIFELEMNADWVVLSACNTGTAAGVGAEAVSGLGRAFFYAGARALLVSNWPVETTSARILTSDVFTRQQANPALSRAEALQRAQIALIDGAGFIDPNSNTAVFSYAHPIFWAPFSLIGEGGNGQSAGESP